MNKNFKTILAVGLTAVLVACGSNKKVVEQQPAEGSEAEPQVARESIDPQRRANRNVAFDQYFNEIKPDAAPAKPDDKGFIRRWTIIEPINKPNSGNTVFTDSYILAELTKEYFPGQFTADINALPKAADKVIVESEAPRAGGRGGFGGGRPAAGAQAAPAAPATMKDTLEWHSVDSKLFNIKLIRFAQGTSNGQKRYGLIFNAFTVINCDQDIPNVRLSAGSNASSIWWVNGEQVLKLQADRRMVADDGMSKRITLKKGKNIVRGAVINGPGMSDMCVRFYNEDGTILKNYTITNK